MSIGFRVWAGSVASHLGWPAAVLGTRACRRPVRAVGTGIRDAQRTPESAMSHAPHEARAPDREWKLLAGLFQADFARAWLAHACLPDPRFPRATVSSVYFDTPTLDHFAEKSCGEFLKVKYRLRWYDPEQHPRPDRRLAFLEIKQRAGWVRRKVRVPMELDRAWLEAAELDDPGFVDILLRQHATQGQEPLLPVLPALVRIRYTRHRFVCPWTLAHVSLDTGVHVEAFNRRLIPATGCAIIPRVIVEIKGTPPGDIPWLFPLYEAGFRVEAFSKYGACLEALIGEA